MTLIFRVTAALLLTLVTVVDPANAQEIPSNLVATVDGPTVTLSWKGTAPGWQIEAGVSPGATGIVVRRSGPMTTMIATSVLPGSYFVRVRSYAAGVAGPPSNEINVIVVLLPPGPPRFLSGSVVGSSVSLAWAAGSGDRPTGYIIEAGSGPGLANLAVFARPAAAAAFQIHGVGPGFYYVRVRASNDAGASINSNEVILAVACAGSSAITRIAAPPDTFGIVESSVGMSPNGRVIMFEARAPNRAIVVRDLEAERAPGSRSRFWRGVRPRALVCGRPRGDRGTGARISHNLPADALSMEQDDRIARDHCSGRGAVSVRSQ